MSVAERDRYGRPTAVRGRALRAAGVLLGAAWLVGGLSVPAQAQGSPSGGSHQHQRTGQRSFPAQFDHLGVAAGPEDAAVTVREFGDYQCPACRQFSSAAQKLREEYVDKGGVRFIFFDFPLVSQHDNALAAAQAARCAGEQGDYWAMHDMLFERQRSWKGASDPAPEFRDYASEIGLDGAVLAGCVRDEDKRGAVMTSRSFGQQLGVRATPTVMVGSRYLPGVPSYDKLERVVREQLEADR